MEEEKHVLGGEEEPETAFAKVQMKSWTVNQERGQEG